MSLFHQCAQAMCHSEVNTTRQRRMRQRRHRHCRAQYQLEVEVLYLNSRKNLKEETHKSYVQFLSEKMPPWRTDDFAGGHAEPHHKPQKLGENQCHLEKPS